MSRGAYWLPALRWGQRMGDGKVIDMMVGALTDPFDDCHMGITAENVAEKWNITREEQDEFAVESHRRAADGDREGLLQGPDRADRAQEQGRHDVFDTDEHVRAGRDGSRAWRSCKPAFKKRRHGHRGQRLRHQRRRRRGRADGAAGGRGAAGLKPMARLVAYGHAGVDPKFMGIGPVPAVRSGAGEGRADGRRHGRHRVNEAFAAQALAVMRELGPAAQKDQPATAAASRSATRSARPAAS